MTDLVLDSLNVIRDFYLVSLKPEELSTQRIMVHIKLLVQRIITGTQVDFKERVLYNVFEDFPKAYTCASSVQKFIEERLKEKINQQEMVYLTIHLNRLEMVQGL
jgi:beta-glucoside operon transcriptional antiterminator